MIPDPTAEIKRIRHELGAADGFDVGRIFARLRQLEAETDRKVVRRSPRRIADNHAVHRSDGGDIVGNGGSTPAAR